MTPLERYQADLKRPEFFHDAAQENAVRHLQRLYDDLVADDRSKSGLLGKLSADEAVSRFKDAVDGGLLKIMSKMGISTIASYRGAQLFEIVGLADEVVSLCFPGVPSRIQGAGFAELEAGARELAALAASPTAELAPGGRHKLVVGGESHLFNPDVINSLQRAVRSGDDADYRAYAAHVDGRPPSTLRDLLRLRTDVAPIPLEDVEPAEAILRRFTKKNVQHPTYKAFAELGKAIKTIFLCRYLHDEALRVTGN